MPEQTDGDRADFLVREAYVLSHVGEERLAAHFGVDVETARHWVDHGGDAPAYVMLWLREQAADRLGLSRSGLMPRIPRHRVWYGRGRRLVRRLVRRLAER
jgi:hypothetical protein